MDSTDELDEQSSEECVDSDLREPTPDKDSSTNLIAGFLWMFFLFMATTYLSQLIVLQSLNNFHEDLKSMEDICDRSSKLFNLEKCECVYDYFEGLDHPKFQIYFHKLILPGIDNSKKFDVDVKSNPENLFIDPKAYVVGCGKHSPDRQYENKIICDELDKLITTDLYTKWWYRGDADCFNSIVNTAKRINPVMVFVYLLILLAMMLTPIRILRNCEII